MAAGDKDVKQAARDARIRGIVASLKTAEDLAGQSDRVLDDVIAKSARALALALLEVATTLQEELEATRDLLISQQGPRLRVGPWPKVSAGEVDPRD